MDSFIFWFIQINNNKKFHSISLLNLQVSYLFDCFLRIQNSASAEHKNMTTYHTSIYFLCWICLLFGCYTPSNAVFFNESGITFLKKYGQLYRLTETFFFERDQTLLQYPETSMNSTIDFTYETRKQSQHSYYGTGLLEVEIFD